MAQSTPTDMDDKKMREKERMAEHEFKQWLDSNEIPYWYIHQEIDTFSPALRHYLTKRPDFVILIPVIGFIITDVEYKEPAKKYDQFQINAEETIKYENLQKRFNLPVWYVFSNAKQHFSVWYWIPTSHVISKGQIFPSKNKTEYYAVPITECIQVSKTDSLERLFSQMTKFH